MEEQSGTLEEIELSTSHISRPVGKAEANHQNKLDRRRNVEWWVKIIGQMGVLLTGLLGTLIGPIHNYQEITRGINARFEASRYLSY
jgi:hypothetical protein